MNSGRIKEQPSAQGQPSDTCASNESHQRAVAGSKQSVPVALPHEGFGRKQFSGQEITESPQCGLPPSTTSNACGASIGPHTADVGESPFSVKTFPSIARGADLVDARPQSPIIQRSQGAPEAEQHALPRGTRELDLSSPARQSDHVQGAGNENSKLCSTAIAQAENKEVLEHRGPMSVPERTGLVGKPSKLKDNLEGKSNEGDSRRTPKCSQGATGEKPLNMEDTLTYNALHELATADGVKPSHALTKKTPEMEKGSPADSCVHQSQELEGSSYRRTQRHITYSVAPFVPLVGRPTKAAQHGPIRDSVHAEPAVESNEQNTSLDSEGAVSNLGRRVSLALRNAYSIFGKVAPRGRQQPVQGQGENGVSHAAVGWLRGRSSDEAAELQAETPVEKEKVIIKSIHGLSVDESGSPSISWPQLSLSSTPPVVQRTPPVCPVEDIESDRQILEAETKRWGRRLTAVNNHEPRALGTGPTLNPFRQMHRTEEFVETQLQPMPRKK